MAASPEFEERVKSFEDAETPRIPNGEELKKKTVDALNNLITTAKTGGSNADIEANWQQVNGAIQDMNAAAEDRAQP